MVTIWLVSECGEGLGGWVGVMRSSAPGVIVDKALNADDSVSASEEEGKVERQRIVHGRTASDRVSIRAAVGRIEYRDSIGESRWRI